MSFFNRFIEDFPENLIADILSRLYVKKVIHCKSVCKNCWELVSDSYFVGLHLSRSPASVMIHHELGEFDDTRLHHAIVMNLEPNLLPDFQDFLVLLFGSVNGLICLSLTDTSRYKFNIWVMKDYGIKKAWHKEVVIMESIHPNKNWPIRDSMNLLEPLKDGTILMSFEDKLFVYCPRKKTIEGGVFSKISLARVSYPPSFIKLQTFESERVQVGLCSEDQENSCPELLMFD
ncbi:F-box associated domain containing protein [Tanacetum coccineum]|uniref:F-box associated domain containing protein n=1 Tax=Tanacetum coccineum TaxID=301880 RepID=A0ABQ4ZN30_9ASTR